MKAALTLTILAALAAPAAAQPVAPTYWLIGPVLDGEPAVVATWLAEAQRAGLKRVYVEIDSPGGGAAPGLAIAEALRMAPVTTICTVRRQASSAAYAILQACSIRIGKRGALFSTHEPKALANGLVTRDEARSLMIQLEAFTVLYETAVQSRMEPKTTREGYRARVAAGLDWKMSADECLAAGGLDKVVP